MTCCLSHHPDGKLQTEFRNLNFENPKLRVGLFFIGTEKRHGNFLPVSISFAYVNIKDQQKMNCSTPSILIKCRLCLYAK